MKSIVTEPFNTIVHFSRSPNKNFCHCHLRDLGVSTCLIKIAACLTTFGKGTRILAMQCTQTTRTEAASLSCLVIIVNRKQKLLAIGARSNIVGFTANSTLVCFPSLCEGISVASRDF